MSASDEPPKARDSASRLASIEAPQAVREVGEALDELQQMPKTRRGRALLRGALVGFALVFLWISAIVYVQWRNNRRPDFRVLIEEQLRGIRASKYQEIYAEASPRFQELVRFETFNDKMEDIREVLGAFREISSIITTKVNRGPSGMTSWIQFRLVFEKGLALGSMSFHRTGGKWRLLHYSVQLPPDIARIEDSVERRQARSQAPPEVALEAQYVLELLRDKKYSEVWNRAMPVFQESISVAELAELERERAQELGSYRRIISVTRTTNNPAGSSAGFDAIAEFEKASVRISLSFARTGLKDWRLASYQLVMPMPRVQTEALPTNEELLREMATPPMRPDATPESANQPR